MYALLVCKENVSAMRQQHSFMAKVDGKSRIVLFHKVTMSKESYYNY